MKTKLRLISFFSGLTAAAVICSGCSDSVGSNNVMDILNSANSQNSSSESSSTVIIDTSLQETTDWKFQYDEEAGGIIIKECLCANKKSDDLLKSKDADIVVPSSFDGFDGIKVIGIGENAFYNRIMKSLTLPNTIKSIDSNAFSSVEINDTIIIPDSVVSIGEKAFSNATIMNTITIPKSVTSIGKEAFSYSYIKSVTLPPLEAIGSSMFYGSGVEKVVMTEGTRVITNSAFSNCNGIQEIIIPDSVEEIDRHGLFILSNKLLELRLPDNLKSIDQLPILTYGCINPKITFKGKTYDFPAARNNSSEEAKLREELQAAIDSNV